LIYKNTVYVAVCRDVFKTSSGKTKTKSKTVALKTKIKTKTLAVKTKTKMLALLVNIDCHHHYH